MLAKRYMVLRESGDVGAALNIGLLSDHISFAESAAELSKPLRSAFEKWSERLLVEKCR